MLHRGRIVYERYFGALEPHLPHMCHSVTKSYAGTLTAAFVHEGLLDDGKAIPHYLPELRGTAWDHATLRQVMDMQTGLPHTEVYADENSDVWAYARTSGLRSQPVGYDGPRTLWDYLRTVRKEGTHGGEFAYKTVNIEVMAWVMARVTGRTFAQLLHERLWAPLGCEENGYVVVDPIGMPLAGAGLSATLRDLARFGELMRCEGEWERKQLIPAAVVHDLQKGDHPARLPSGGSYRSQWWVTHDELGAFLAGGIHGQRLYVAPKAETVIARFASHPLAASAASEPIITPLMLAIGRMLRGQPARARSGTYTPPQNPRRATTGTSTYLSTKDRRRDRERRRTDLAESGQSIEKSLEDSMEKYSREDDCHSVQQDGSFDAIGSIATNVVDGFTMVAVGDIIVSRALTTTQDAAFGAIVKVLHDADVTFGNMEMNIFDIRTFKGSPQAEYGGAYHVSLPEIGPDLKAMGFNIVGRANNHTFDWGVEGMLETSRMLDQSGIVHAGAGENLAQAGAARFLETARGRVALVSFASSFTPMSRACDPAGEAPGRAGLSSLRLAQRIMIPLEMLESLRRIRNLLPGSRPSTEDPHRVILAGVTYSPGDKAGYSYEPDPRDVASILRNVRRGKQFADFCIVTNHGHEPGNWSQDPPDYEQSFAHRVIDAGADAYVVHGPHQLRGIEIYKGRPIFYSLANFIYDELRTPVGADMFDVYGKDPRIDTDADVTVAEEAKGYPTAEGFVGALSAPVFYESVVTVSRFEQNQLAELRLYPIELGYSKRFANRGIPRLAPAPQAKVILERLQKLSMPFDTQIAIENDVGVIRLKPSSP